jgi:hypothetical protein
MDIEVARGTLAATRNVEHYALTPDNNLVENAIRPSS